jgi:hypothetical protein
MGEGPMVASAHHLCNKEAVSTSLPGDPAIHSSVSAELLHSPVMWLLCFHRGLIASSFTETHYLQDGTDVSLARNYTVSAACLDQQNPELLNLRFCFVAILFPASHMFRFIT